MANDGAFTQRGASLVRLGEIAMILELHWQGVSVSAIARQVGLDRKTVHKYIERGLEPPMYGPRAPRASKIAPFTRYLREGLAAFPQLTGRVCIASCANSATPAATAF